MSHAVMQLNKLQKYEKSFTESQKYNLSRIPIIAKYVYNGI